MHDSIFHDKKTTTFSTSKLSILRRYYLIDEEEQDVDGRLEEEPEGPDGVGTVDAHLLGGLEVREVRVVARRVRFRHDPRDEDDRCDDHHDPAKPAHGDGWDGRRLVGDTEQAEPWDDLSMRETTARAVTAG